MFDDGTVWGTAQIDAAPITPTAAGSVNGTGAADWFDLRNAASSNTVSGSFDSGNDTYLFGRQAGQDAILDSGIATDQIWLRHVGTNLEVSIIGTANVLTLQNWYSSSSYRVEQLKTEEGKTLLSSQVENLVQAMASFSPPAPGQEALPPEYASQLNAVIAANWQ